MIYLDNAATTMIDERVSVAMKPFCEGMIGNPSSSHSIGREAKAVLDKARSRVALLFGCAPREVIFTSGATEANAMAVIGIAQARESVGRHIIISAIEHHSVLESAEYLEREGWAVSVIPVDKTGMIDCEQLQEEVNGGTTLVSIMMVNNEIGSVQPIDEIARMVKKKNPHTVVHSDIVQAFGFMDCRAESLGVDALTISGHKIHGPKGVGALYLKEGTMIDPIIRGGSQEHGFRAGTENIAGIVGLGAAAIVVSEEGAEYTDHIDDMRLLLKHKLEKKCKGLVKVISPDDSAPHVLGILFPGIDRDVLLTRLDQEGVAVSSGSACISGAHAPSHVIQALGYTEDEAQTFIRFSLSKHTTEKEIKKAVRIVQRCLEGIKKTA